MIPDDLQAAVAGAVHAVCGPLAAEKTELITVARPADRSHGDWSSPVALRLAGAVARPALALASDVATALAEHPAIASASVHGPGFLGIEITADARAEIAWRLADHYATRPLADAPDPAPLGGLAEYRGAAHHAFARRVGTQAPVGRVGAVRANPPSGAPDLIRHVGGDAVTFALVRDPAGDDVVLDVAALRTRTPANPVHGVQYAHSRTRRVAENAREAGVCRDDGVVPRHLDHPAERAVLDALADACVAETRARSTAAPHVVARHAEVLADTVLAWMATGRSSVPSGPERVDERHSTRQWLVDAAGLALRRSLTLLGVSAPDRL